ncbi:MAG: hypothetical protein WBP80_10280, partial [Planifilum fulgidum]
VRGSALSAFAAVQMLSHLLESVAGGLVTASFGWPFADSLTPLEELVSVFRTVFPVPEAAPRTPELKKMSFWAHCSSDAAFRPAADDGLGPLRQKSVTIGTNRPLFRWTLSGVWSIGGSIPTPSYSLHEEDPERAKEALFCFPRKPNDRPSRISVREAVTSGVPPGGRPMTAIMARAASLQPASMIPRSGGWLGSFSAAPLAKRFRRGFYAGVALCRHGGVSLGVVKGSGKLEDGYFATACSGA